LPGKVAGARGIAPVQKDLPRSEKRERVVRDLFEDRHRLIDQSLASPKLPESHDGLGRHRRSNHTEVRRRVGEFLLSLRPRAAPDENAGVVCATDAVEELNAHPGGPLLDAAAPLRCAVVIPHPLAGVEHVAAAPDGRPDLAELSAQRGRRRLVQPRHSVLHATVGHERDAFGREAHHLEVHVAEAAAELGCALPQLADASCIVRGQSLVGLVDAEPPVLQARLGALQEPAGPGEPSLGHGRLAAKVDVVVAEPGGDPGRTAHIAS
jgi:hypothetical protein